MKILFLDAYFEPEQTSYTHLEADLLDCLTNDGNEVQIICPTPTRGISDEIRKKYKNKKKESRGKGVSVLRFCAPDEGKNPLIRAIRYFWCNLKTLQLGKRMKGIDAVFSNSTPPTQGFIAAKVAKKLKVPFIFNLQDIFPDSLVNTGMTKKGSLLYKIGRRIENYTYNNAAKIIVIGESFKQNIIEKGVPEEKIAVIPNWIDAEEVKPVSREDNKLFDEYNIDRYKFIVLYAGNFGASQGTNVILDAARLLKNEKNIQFVLFGGGSEFESAKTAVHERGLTNVFINPLLPPERISEVYSMGDVALITCKKGVGKAAMPSKALSIMACNTPIIASFDTDSDLSALLEESGGGICIEPESKELLANKIEIKYNERFSSAKRKCNSREYIINNFSQDICLSEYLREIKNPIGS